jgi:hypothetical protein
MRKPYVGLRAFLLLITLVSLVAATFALWARTANLYSAQEHALHAHQEWLSAKWWEDRILSTKKYLKETQPISLEWAVGCDLRLMPSVQGEVDIPSEGKDLVVVAEEDGEFRFRMFSGDGKIIVDWVEGPRANDLNRQFMGLWPPHELTGSEKARVIIAVTSIIAASRATVQANLRNMHATDAEAIVKAEHHEQLARRP